MSPPNGGKRVCGRCNREFESGRALGGHVKTHYRERRKTRFTRRKRSTKRTSLDLLHSYLYPIKKNTTITQQQEEVGRGGCRGGPDRGGRGRGGPDRDGRGHGGSGSYLYPIKKHNTTTQQQHQQRGSGGGGGSSGRGRGGGGGSREIVDLSKSLSGMGWQVRRKRGSNAVKTTREVSPPNYDYHYDYYYNDDDDDDYDDDDDDDEDGFTVMERLRRCGITGNAHRISRTRRLYVCKTCSVHLPTFHAVLVHVNDCRCSSDTTDSIEVYQVPPVMGEEVGGGAEEQEEEEEATSMEVVDDLEEEEVDEEEEEEEEDGEMGADEEEEEEEDDGRTSGEPSSEVDQATVEEAEEVSMEKKSAAMEDVVGVTARVEGEDEMAGAKASTRVADEAAGNSTGSMDQDVAASMLPKGLDFDLNDMPPEED